MILGLMMFAVLAWGFRYRLRQAIRARVAAKDAVLKAQKAPSQFQMARDWSYFSFRRGRSGAYRPLDHRDRAFLASHQGAVMNYTKLPSGAVTPFFDMVVEGEYLIKVGEEPVQ